MAPKEIDEVAKKLADVRLQVHALQAATKDASLPETLKQTRRTIHWSAAAIAVALIVSSCIKACTDARVHDFDHRLEVLERGK